MGGWAIFANRAHALPIAFLAGVVQGALSGTITFFMKKSLEKLLHFFLKIAKFKMALLAPPLIVCSISLSILIVSHVAAQTPEIVATIAVPFSVAFTYACVYNALVWIKVKHRYERT